MKTKMLYGLFTFSLFLSLSQVYAKDKRPFADTTCCTPDSLKVVSLNYPIFCVSWHVPSDSSCIRPYGFIIQVAKFPGSGPWKEKIVIYSTGGIINFCDSIDSCGAHQWRVKTICISNGITTYSDWVYGNKFNFNCSLDGRSKYIGASFQSTPTGNIMDHNLIFTSVMDNKRLHHFNDKIYGTIRKNIFTFTTKLKSET